MCRGEMWKQLYILAEAVFQNTFQMGMRTYVARVWPFNKGVIHAFTVTRVTHNRISDKRSFIDVVSFVGVLGEII